MNRGYAFRVYVCFTEIDLAERLVYRSATRTTRFLLELAIITDSELFEIKLISSVKFGLASADGNPVKGKLDALPTDKATEVSDSPTTLTNNACPFPLLY